MADPTDITFVGMWGTPDLAHRRTAEPEQRQQPTTPATHRVTAPSVIIRGHLGSQGIFYQGEGVAPWPTANALNDYATAEELGRLTHLGMIEPTQ